MHLRLDGFCSGETFCSDENGMTAIAETLSKVNECQVAALKKAGTELDPEKNRAEFTSLIHNVQAAVVHTYQMSAFASVQEPDPKKAAMIWKEMMDYCESALTVLKDLKDKYFCCGAPELYDLVLDYRGEAQKRYYQNLQDSECQIPPGLFPEMN
jgi:hypothetical protein